MLNQTEILNLFTGGIPELLFQNHIIFYKKQVDVL